MAHLLSPELLNRVAEALRQPTAARRSPNVTMVRRLTRQGWATAADIEDLLLDEDGRLSSHRLASVETWATLLDLPWRWVAPSAVYRDSEPVLMPMLPLSDITALLIELERWGFCVDPTPWVNQLRPTLLRQISITASELAILRYGKERHRRAPVRFATHQGPPALSLPEKWSTPTGYRVELWRDIHGAPERMVVHAPRYRPRPDPIEVTCAVCGFSYVKGLREEDAAHRAEHKARLAYLEPKTLPTFVQALGPQATALRVTPASPRWQRNEVYVRAAAFRRELHFDFVQWSPGQDEDPKAEAYLLAGDQGRIVGACVFRLEPGNGPHAWYLDWVWICPRERRRGHLTRQWGSWEERYGRFGIEPPVSEAMQAFLRSRGRVGA